MKRSNEGGDDPVASKKTRRDEPASAALVARVTDPYKLSQRQKQIDYGKNTRGYERYAHEVALRQRRREDPHTPDITEPDSKRQFDGRVKEWRRRLHAWEQAHPEAVAQDGATEPPGAAAAAPEATGPEQPSQALFASAADRQKTAAELEAFLSSAPTSTGLAAGDADIDDALDAYLDDDDEEDEEGLPPIENVANAARDAPDCPSFQPRTSSSGTAAPAAAPRVPSIYDASPIDDGWAR